MMQTIPSILLTNVTRLMLCSYPHLKLINVSAVRAADGWLRIAGGNFRLVPQFSQVIVGNYSYAT